MFQPLIAIVASVPPFWCSSKGTRVQSVQLPCSGQESSDSVSLCQWQPQNLSKAGDFIRSCRALICRNRRKFSSPPLPLHFTFLLSLQWNDTFCCTDECQEIPRSQARFVSITQMHSVFSTREINRLISLVHHTINDLCAQTDLIHSSPVVHTTNAASCLL